MTAGQSGKHPDCHRIRHASARHKTAVDPRHANGVLVRWSDLSELLELLVLLVLSELLVLLV